MAYDEFQTDCRQNASSNFHPPPPTTHESFTAWFSLSQVHWLKYNFLSFLPPLLLRIFCHTAFQNELKWKGSLLPFSSCCIFCADLERLSHVHNSYPALSSRKDIPLLTFVLLSGTFSTLSTWKTLMLWPALWLLHSAKFLPAHCSHQSATFSCMVSWLPYFLLLPFSACSFQTTLFLLFLECLFTKFVLIAAIVSPIHIEVIIEWLELEETLKII